MDLSRLPRPEPAAGIDAYAAELAERFAGYPETAANWERYKANPRTATPDYLPIRLDVENVSRCNFACTMCAVSTWPHGKRAGDMTLEQFQALIDEQVGLVEIKLNGLGEPLMGKDYFSMIHYARDRRIWVRMTTNGSLLHLSRNIERLIDSGVCDVDISIDGADKETFEAIRVQSDFDQVKLNCKALNDHCSRLGVTLTKMWTLVQRRNCDNLPQHVWLAAELGFKHMIFSVQLHGWGDDALAARNKAQQTGITQDEAGILMAIGKRAGVRVAFWDVSEKFEPVDGKRCPWPFERAVVTSDLRTVPCCMVGDPDAFELGKGLPFKEAWAGEEYRAFRQAHLDGKIPNICKACYRSADG